MAGALSAVVGSPRGRGLRKNVGTSSPVSPPHCAPSRAWNQPVCIGQDPSHQRPQGHGQPGATRMSEGRRWPGACEEDRFNYTAGLGEVALFKCAKAMSAGVAELGWMGWERRVLLLTPPLQIPQSPPPRSPSPKRHRHPTDGGGLQTALAKQEASSFSILFFFFFLHFLSFESLGVRLSSLFHQPGMHL